MIQRGKLNRMQDLDSLLMEHRYQLGKYHFELHKHLLYNKILLHNLLQLLIIKENIFLMLQLYKKLDQQLRKYHLDMGFHTQFL